MANNSAPHARRATSVALCFMVANMGGILATWMLGFLSPPPNYTKATLTSIIMSVGGLMFCFANLYYLQRQNHIKAQRRLVTVKEDESDGLGDRSAWFVYKL